MSYNSKHTGAQVEALLDKVDNTYTKAETDGKINDAIAAAITQTLNTAV